MYCPGFEVYYVFLLDFGLGALLISLFLACMGLYSTLNGTTPYEDKRNIQVEDIFNSRLILFI